MWLHVDITNHDPLVVASYMNTINSIRGCPRLVPVDKGAENDKIVANQICLTGLQIVSRLDPQLQIRG